MLLAEYQYWFKSLLAPVWSSGADNRNASVPATGVGTHIEAVVSALSVPLDAVESAAGGFACPGALSNGPYLNNQKGIRRKQRN
jgi:hypothetical protein